MRRSLFASLLIAAMIAAGCDAGTPVATVSLPKGTEETGAPQTHGQVAVIGNGDGIRFLGPNRVVLDSEQNLLVTEFGGGRILKISPGGELLDEFAGGGTGIGELAGPTGLDLDAAGFLYVGESGTSRVQVFSPSGAPVAVWGQFGIDPGEFGSAMGVAVNDELDRVHVADHVNSRIQVYNRNGELLFMFPRGGDFTHIGDAPDQMWLPIGVDISADGTVFVVDSGNRRVQTYTPDGEVLTNMDTSPISDPQTIHVEPDGSYWVGGVADGEVARFSNNGMYLFSLAQPDGGFRAPHGIFTDGDRVWVADTGNNVVRIYELGAEHNPIPLVASELTESSAAAPDAFAEMFSFGYAPSTMTVVEGQTIEWTNTSETPHTVTVTGTFDSGGVAAGGSFAFTFTDAGTYSYFCTIHGASLQAGVVVVEPAG